MPKSGLSYRRIIEPGAIVMQYGFVGNSDIGPYLFVDQFGVVGHRNQIGRHVYVGSYASIGDNCTIGDYVCFGPRSSIENGRKVCNGALVCPDAAVKADIVEPGIYGGIPARRLKCLTTV